MKKKPPATNRTAVAKTKPADLASLITEVRSLIQSARRGVASVVDTFQAMTNFEIGRRIVEHEQKGAKRAAYGQELLKQLSLRLTEEFGKGFSRSNLEYMRKFFLLWQDRVSQISQHPTGNSPLPRIQQTPSVELAAIGISQQPAGKFSRPFTLSWTHYVELVSIKDSDERSFYEIEATSSGWSVPELRRQKASCLYERLSLSRDKAGMYVNYYDREVKLPDENPTIGLLLCKEKKDAVVKLTLPKGANIHAKEYQLYFPSKELLREKLLAWSSEAEAVARNAKKKGTAK